MSFKHFILFFFFLTGCVARPEAPLFGADLCDYCSMKIHDHRYGGEILTEKGKSYKFDALECLLKFEARKLDKQEKVKQRYVFHTFKKGELIPLEQAYFLNIPGTRSPMGLGIWASDSTEEISKAQRESGGEVLNWSHLENLLKQ